MSVLWHESKSRSTWWTLVATAFCALVLVACAGDPAQTSGTGGGDQSGEDMPSRRGDDTGVSQQDVADEPIADAGASDGAVSDAPSLEDAGTDSETSEDVSTDSSGDEGGADADADEPGETADTGGEDVAEDGGTGVPDLPDIDTTCVEIFATAEQVAAPADIIWIIDSSESMDNEIDIVRANINTFASIIGGSGIDYRVTLISADKRIDGGWFGQSYHGVCVPPPLSAADQCPDVDNPGVFLHVRVGVYSTDSLDILINQYSAYQSFLRPEAKLHIVEVSDDESYRNVRWFRDEVAALAEPGFPEDFKFHSIVQTPGDSCGDDDGDRYITLSDATGGVVASICESEWAPIFDAIQEVVIEDSELPCYYAMPEVADHIEIVLDEVNVYFTPDDGERTQFPNVDSEADCGETDAWYYDNPDAPSGLSLCPAACGDEVEGDLEIAFGCDTIKI